MDELKKMLKVCIYAVGIICILGFVISIIGDKLAADAMTIGVFLLAGYGGVTLVKKLKEKG